MSDTASYILTSVENGVATIRINRADKKNALTADMYQRMADGLKNAFADKDVRSVLILGVPGSFSAGNDIADFMKVAMNGQRDSMAVFDFLEQIIMASKPVVAGVDGLAIGVGTTMLMHCDLVIASDGSRFKTPFVDLGLVPEAGSSLIGPELMGHHRAFAMLALGEEFSAQDAREAGIVNRIVPSGELEEVALSVARNLAAKPMEALEITRNLVRVDRSKVLERMKEEAVLFGERLASEEAKQAFMAFMAKGKG